MITIYPVSATWYTETYRGYYEIDCFGMPFSLSSYAILVTPQSDLVGVRGSFVIGPSHGGNFGVTVVDSAGNGVQSEFSFMVLSTLV